MLNDGDTVEANFTACFDGGTWSAPICEVESPEGFVNWITGTQKENNMNISADFEGKIKRIGKQFLLQLGCQEFICQTLTIVGYKITDVLTEEYKKKDTPDGDEG